MKSPSRRLLCVLTVGIAILWANACGSDAQSQSASEPPRGYNAPRIVASEPSPIAPAIVNGPAKGYQGEANFPLSKKLTIYFSAPVDPTTMITKSDGLTNGTGAAVVVDSTNRAVPGRWAFANASNTILTFTPADGSNDTGWVGQSFFPGSWKPRSAYGFYVSRSAGSPLVSKKGERLRLEEAYVLAFSTDVTPPSVRTTGSGSSASIAVDEIPGFPPASVFQVDPSGGGGVAVKKGCPGTFDPISASMTQGRWYHTATALQDNRVIFIGGLINGSGLFGTPTQTAELFDPSQDKFTAAGTLKTSRFGHTASLQDSGDVMIIGGADASAPLNTAELYRPEPNGPGNFILLSGGATGEGGLPTMGIGRWGHTSTMLGGSQMVIIGGYEPSSSFGGGVESSNRVYIVKSGNFYLLQATMLSWHSQHEAVLLPNLDGATAIIAMGGSKANSANIPPTPPGGFPAPAPALAPSKETDIFVVDTVQGDLLKSTVKAGPRMNQERQMFTATPLDRLPVIGMVVLTGGASAVAGGAGGIQPGLTSIEVYDPQVASVGNFTVINSANLQISRLAHRANLLTNGKILITGGVTAFQPGLPQDDTQWHIASAQQNGCLNDSLYFDPKFLNLNNDRDQISFQSTTAPVGPVDVTACANFTNASATMAQARGWHTMTQLGNVHLVAAGDSSGQIGDASIDRFTE